MRANSKSGLTDVLGCVLYCSAVTVVITFVAELGVATAFAVFLLMMSYIIFKHVKYW